MLGRLRSCTLSPPNDLGRVSSAYNARVSHRARHFKRAPPEWLYSGPAWRLEPTIPTANEATIPTAKHQTEQVTNKRDQLAMQFTRDLYFTHILSPLSLLAIARISPGKRSRTYWYVYAAWPASVNDLQTPQCTQSKLHSVRSEATTQILSFTFACVLVIHIAATSRLLQPSLAFPPPHLKQCCSESLPASRTPPVRRNAS
jgi:hypothetical protein